MKKLVCALMVVVGMSGSMFAQEDYAENGGFNPNSVRPIHVSQQMFRKTLWRMMDLREPQNKGFFSTTREISTILVDGVKAGKITPYVNDSLTRTMKIEEFIKNITLAGAEDDEFGDDGDDEWGDEDGGDDEWGDDEEGDDDFGDEDGGDDEPISNEYLSKDLYQLEIKEDMIFDRKRSRMYYDIQAMTLYVPSDNPDNLKGVEILIAAFKYQDMVKLFREDKRAIWFNRENNAEHKNMEDAFDLRLFSSFIRKVDNPDDLFIEDIEGSPEKGILGSQKKMFELMELEHNMWEF